MCVGNSHFSNALRSSSLELSHPLSPFPSSPVLPLPRLACNSEYSQGCVHFLIALIQAYATLSIFKVSFYFLF